MTSVENVGTSKSMDTLLLKRHLRLYEKAVDIAACSEYTTRVGAVISKSSRVICGSFNTVRNPAKNVPYGDATTHAEINALRLLPESYNEKCTMYIARI